MFRGLVRHYRLLASEVERLATKPLAKLDEAPVVLVMLGLLQLRFEEGADHATIFETVALAEPMGFKHTKGWVNALLRTAQREGLRGDAAPAGATLAQATSHPDWMVERWSAQFGMERTKEICQANNRFGGAALRPELRRISRHDLLARLGDEGIQTQAHPLLEDALWVERLGPLLSSHAFRDGLIYVQDASSQLAMLWLRTVLTGRVLDACAAPGGKLTHLLGWLPRESEGKFQDSKGAIKPMAADRSLGRLAQVRENLSRLRLPRTPLLVADGTRLPFATAQESTRNSMKGSRSGRRGWDVVLLDAPCSATGMIRKYPELKWRKHAEDLSRLAETQRALLREGARVLRPGGRLVYITCSLEPEENQQAVASFLEEHPAFKRRSFMTLPIPLGLKARPESLLTPEGDLQILPGAAHMGLYAALLVKK